MDITMRTPEVADLDRIRDILASWQEDDAPSQIHPGDLGWHSMQGPSATAEATRVWSRGTDVLGLGFLDGADVFRLATAPDLREDDGLAARLAVDLDDPGRGVLPAGEVSVEVRGVDALARALGERGWTPGEVWSPLRMSLAEPQPAPGIRIEQIDADADDEVLADWAAVHRSAFRGTVLEGEERAAFTSRLRTMLEGPFAGPSRARVIAGYVDDVPDPVAIAAVWSAGPGRPGLLEPMGVHQEHRRRGYGRAIVHASASALADLGASSILVCTETERSAATATYESAGFTPEQTVPDLTRAG